MLMTMRSSVISLTVRVLGTLTSMPDCNTGAVTMKMISSTSTTSTSGVTLMSEIELCVRPLELVKAISADSRRVRLIHRRPMPRSTAFSISSAKSSLREANSRIELPIRL